VDVVAHNKRAWDKQVDGGVNPWTQPVTSEQIADQVRLFLPDTANEARLLDRIDAHINKVVELGFLHRLRGQENQYEVRRILKAFVDAQWLSDFDQRLADYAAHGGAGSVTE